MKGVTHRNPFTEKSSFLTEWVAIAHSDKHKINNVPAIIFGLSLFFMLKTKIITATMIFVNKGAKKGENINMKSTKESLKVDTSEGLLIVESYDDGCAKGVKISVNGDTVALIDVTNDGEIRLLGYKEQCDEPSIYYSVNR